MLETELETLEADKKRIEDALSSGEETDHQMLFQLGQDLLKTNQTLDEKTLRWLELSEKGEG